MTLKAEEILQVDLISCVSTAGHAGQKQQQLLFNADAPAVIPALCRGCGHYSLHFYFCLVLMGITS